MHVIAVMIGIKRLDRATSDCDVPILDTLRRHDLRGQAQLLQGIVHRLVVHISRGVADLKKHVRKRLFVEPKVGLYLQSKGVVLADEIVDELVQTVFEDGADVARFHIGA